MPANCAVLGGPVGSVGLSQRWRATQCDGTPARDGLVSTSELRLCRQGPLFRHELEHPRGPPIRIQPALYAKSILVTQLKPDPLIERFGITPTLQISDAMIAQECGNNGAIHGNQAS